MGHLHESLRLYTICKAMKWNHLPVGGGLYDQHPQFLDDMFFLMQEDAKAEKKARDRQERRAKGPSGKTATRRRR
jgi:hypothetical protein